MPTFKHVMLPGLSLWLGLLVTVFSQNGPAPEDRPPPPEAGSESEKQVRDHDRDRDRDGEGGREYGRGRRGGRDRDPFRHLTDEQRKKVREAFEKVWASPEVIDAREKLRVANDEYRKVMQEALAKADPEVAELLEKNRPKPPPWPDKNDPEFAAKVIERLLSGPGPEPIRDQRFRERLEKILDHPAVAELVAKLKQATPEQRMIIAEELRERFFKQLRESDFRPDGGSGPGPDRDRDKGPPGPRPDAPPPPRPKAE